MRGIERVLAAVLLVGAVGGAAVFASHSGSSPGADVVRLAAPPEQHLSGPAAVLIAPTPADRGQGVRVVTTAAAAVVPTAPAIRRARSVGLVVPVEQTVRLRRIVPTPVPATPAPFPVPVPTADAPPVDNGPVVTAAPAPEPPRAPAASDPVPAAPAPVADPPDAIPAPPIQVTPVPVQTLPDPPPDLHGFTVAPGPQPTPVDTAEPAQGPPAHLKGGPAPTGD